MLKLSGVVNSVVLNVRRVILDTWKCINAAHKETSALLRSTQNIVRRKHHVPVHRVPSTAIIVPNYVRYDAKTSLDY